MAIQKRICAEKILDAGVCERCGKPAPKLMMLTTEDEGGARKTEKLCVECFEADWFKSPENGESGGGDPPPNAP